MIWQNLATLVLDASIWLQVGSSFQCLNYLNILSLVFLSLLPLLKILNIPQDFAATLVLRVLREVRDFKAKVLILPRETVKGVTILTSVRLLMGVAWQTHAV